VLRGGGEGCDEQERKREKKQRKRIEDAVQYALSHKARVEILILLNEANYTIGELADLTGLPITNVSNHIRRMHEDSSVEVAKIEERRGTNVYWYRAVEIPCYTTEEAKALTEMQRQVTAGLVVQSGTAEVMAALRNGTLADPRTILSWDWYNVDAEGRDELEAENMRHTSTASGKSSVMRSTAASSRVRRPPQYSSACSDSFAHASLADRACVTATQISKRIDANRKSGLASPAQRVPTVVTAAEGTTPRRGRGHRGRHTDPAPDDFKMTFLHHPKTVRRRHRHTSPLTAEAAMDSGATAWGGMAVAPFPVR
jgi:DNA-binding transcriptional ArsR family regulator